ncbi:aminotransferase class V-fold PLP-dependent enzyme [Planomicrobium sp. CPCC 101110]|uniref:aminotransferase class V-fold PLP-dependent enzyme n=1 Tax=Planomicrobium sp. CPCC 101110 TaxID=2599619 RepID=UPI0011B3714E|nr:aminotransferase class V-fold PLP-dependent enzyme [Planomicrobium sp. CPCC 101110]TWT24627.1 aminotransferase class V-fold PLP-dependent enzyme [Planomicrobium sp. CPCC 101110]
MYWCKIARTEAEFKAIAKLNYDTFVEEIPQHEKNKEGIRVDPFHKQNTYIIVLSRTELVGMIALRAERPFSLDLKIGEVEGHLPDIGKVCEIRLLAVRKAHRNGRVFFLLARALSDFCCEEGYDSAVISGTTRELKLYAQLGFRPFAEPVGKGDAVFVPMVTTRKQYSESVAARLQTKKKTFFPGPVQLSGKLAAPFGEEAVSHRSAAFAALLEEAKGQLRKMTSAAPHLLSGSGTLANEAMIAQLLKLKAKGLVLVNGEFGRRLKEQAYRWKLDFDVMEEDWGGPFSIEKIKKVLHSRDIGWVLMVHGETSTGVLNDFEKIALLCKEQGAKLCLDCVSSFGAVPFSLENVWLAAAASGKAIGTMSGAAIVFAHHQIEPDEGLPSYVDLGLYAGKIPFTLSDGLLKSLNRALHAYPERYLLLEQRLELLKRKTKDWPLVSGDFPTIMTFRAEKEFEGFLQAAQLSGFELHANSGYLKSHCLFQISCIQPRFEEDLESLMAFHKVYRAYAAT